MTDMLLQNSSIPFNNLGMNQPVVHGKVDIRRLEAARSDRQQQLKKWEEYDRKMRSLEKRKPLQKSQDMEGRVKFQDQYVLLDATLNNDIDEVRYLLERGYDPNLSKDDGLTPLHQACINNNVDMCELLVRFGADVNGRDADQWTPLHTAAACGYVDVCECLLANRADILAINVDGSIPYDLADSEEASQFFLDELKLRGITPKDVEDARSRPERIMADDVLQMYRNGVDLEQLDSQGAAPIHIAAACGYHEVLTTLLQMDVNPDLLDADGWTPAHVAVCWGQIEVLEPLVAYGADFTKQTPNGQDVFALCDTDEIHHRAVTLWENRDRLQAQGSYNPSQTLKRRRSASSVHRSSLREKSNLSKREVMKEVQIAQTTTNRISDSTNDDGPVDETASDAGSSSTLTGPRVLLVNETKRQNESAGTMISSNLRGQQVSGSQLLRRDSKKPNVIHIMRPPTGYWSGNDFLSDSENLSDIGTQKNRWQTGRSSIESQDIPRRSPHVIDSRSTPEYRAQQGHRSIVDSFIRTESKLNNIHTPVADHGNTRVDNGSNDLLSQFSVPSSNQGNSLPRTNTGETNSGVSSSPYGSCCRNCTIL